ncbi:MAG: C10 family peptidase [Candidatus Zixiibacteriota bacterium]|nr:MAG: C10 family peptidase [candidate division Zixibacteria bacterium]
MQTPRLTCARLAALCIIAFIFMPLLSSAEIASVDEMAQVCRNWLTCMVHQKGDWAGSADPKIAEVREITVDDTIIARYFEVDPSGYVLVPILRDLPPVKAYSEKDRLNLDDPDGMPAMLKEVLIHRVRLFVEAYGSLAVIPPDKADRLLGKEHRNQWDFFSKSDEEFEAALSQKGNLNLAEVGPLLTTAWHQNYPYNNDCPMGDGGRTLVGCVATAAAQIMAYHQWPPAGTSSRNYWWDGDNSCNGSTPGAVLSADFSDPYDWENIPDNCIGGCTPEQQAALAELCYEIGVAFLMDYGRCGSGAYTYDGQDLYPFYFRYHNWIEKLDRSAFPLQYWSDLIQAEIEASRPIHYRISRHSIVCDGWRMVETLHQFHMNYGWGGSYNSWFTIDDLYCTWDGCDPQVEYMLTNIVPDRGVYFTVDTTWGQVPLEVEFTGVSTLDVDSWLWDFGDGDSAFVQSPQHTYIHAGRYDVTLEVTAGGETHSYETTGYISALADSLIAVNAAGEPGSTVEVVINASNTVPLRTIKIPVEYGGNLNITLDSFSTAGCRTDYFDHTSQLLLDPYNKRSVFSLYNVESSTMNLEPGSGPILLLYFTIPASATPDQTAAIILDGFLSHAPTFDGPVITYCPLDIGGIVSFSYVCGDADGDESISLIDILYLIAFLYNQPPGPAPAPLMSGDANGDGTPNLLDILYLIEFLYGTPQGPEPVCP